VWSEWERSDWLFVTAFIVSVTWVLLSVMGAHPDGSILGFAGSMWMVWAASLKESDHRELRRHRYDDDEEDPERRRNGDRGADDED
jgi:hypothetical protein